MSMTTSENDTNSRFMLDPTHLGVRLVVLATIAITFLLFISGVASAITRFFGLIGFLAVITQIALSLGAAFGFSWLLERFLKRAWPSGKWLSVTSNRLTLEQPQTDTITIELSDRTNILKWYFVIREGRAWAPKGWYCVACKLSQDENVIIPYAFMKPADASALAGWAGFEELMSRKNASDRDQSKALKQFSEQGQLRTAEKERWNNGVEMSPEDFAQVLNFAGKYESP
jgi:hypothetical protein